MKILSVVECFSDETMNKESILFFNVLEIVEIKKYFVILPPNSQI